MAIGETIQPHTNIPMGEEICNNIAFNFDMEKLTFGDPKIFVAGHLLHHVNEVHRSWDGYVKEWTLQVILHIFLVNTRINSIILLFLLRQLFI